MDKELKSFEAKLRRALTRLEILQDIAYEHELKTGLQIEGHLNDAVSGIADAIDLIEMEKRRKTSKLLP